MTRHQKPPRSGDLSPDEYHWPLRDEAAAHYSDAVLDDIVRHVPCLGDIHREFLKDAVFNIAWWRMVRRLPGGTLATPAQMRKKAGKAINSLEAALETAFNLGPDVQFRIYQGPKGRQTQNNVRAAIETYLQDLRRIRDDLDGMRADPDTGANKEFTRSLAQSYLTATGKMPTSYEYGGDFVLLVRQAAEPIELDISPRIVKEAISWLRSER